MEMISTQMFFPKEMLPYILNENEENRFMRNAMILYPSIRSLKISHGRAAEILGVNKIDLIEFYNSLGLPYLDQSIEDLEEEMSDIKDFFKKDNSIQ